VLELVEAWTGDARLTVVGDGPLAADVRRAAVGRAVDVCGRVARAEAVELMTRSAALVIPGGWPEVAPLTYVEALASGLPIIVRRSTDLAERVVEQGTGAVIDDVREAATAARRMYGDPGLSARCRHVFESLYAADRHRARVLGLYDEVLAAGRP
jgi:1,2-diacylglycerol 3-alpha-glucosyltransferase